MQTLNDAISISRRLDFAIVAYTARMLDDSKGRNSLELKPWVTISPKAPPTLILHAMNDPMDAIRQPMAYALALSDAGVPVDMRLDAKGGPCLRNAANARSDYAGMARTGQTVAAQHRHVVTPQALRWATGCMASASAFLEYHPFRGGSLDPMPPKTGRSPNHPMTAISGCLNVRQLPES